MDGHAEAVRQNLREFFLLERLERSSAALAPAQRSAVRAYQTAASARRRAAQDLRAPDELPSALALYRESALLSILAYLVSRDAALEASTLTPEIALAKFAGAGEDPAGSRLPDIECARKAWMSPDPITLDRFNAEEAARLADELERTTAALAQTVEVRSPRELLITRFLRIGSVALFGLAGIIWLGSALLAPKNLAKHRPATSSSATYGTSAEGAVDGAKNGRFGFHSGDEASPWWTVDLGGPYVISSVKVFGRGDCCFDQSVPLAMEVSDDGATFRPIATRAEPFSESDPWVAKVGPVSARFIRLRTVRRSFLVLSEVEVFGKKP